ncbi:Clp protease N-terminal domain-containing protein [Nakamurella deserti]|uniref:Clp protease N-terminal domain-containing protein n=1 Tax=Nakamurella deserti TaxID=2164074 RepID=UPI000DBE8597|nr:Clp protease N-terminal domain-containing protein [Nakamurella deserti]
MFEQLTPSARTILADAQREAEALGSPAIESEHVVLAVSARAGSSASAAMASAGLDHRRLRELLVEERRRSLATAGVDAIPDDPLHRVSRRGRSLKLATSTKSLLERAVREAGRHRTRTIDEAQLLVAGLQAEVGTVPRLIALAGVDRDDLIARLRERPAA